MPRPQHIVKERKMGSEGTWQDSRGPESSAPAVELATSAGLMIPASLAPCAQASKRAVKASRGSALQRSMPACTGMFFFAFCLFIGCRRCAPECCACRCHLAEVCQLCT